MKKIYIAIATLFGSGFFIIAPGTVGTLVVFLANLVYPFNSLPVLHQQIGMAAFILFSIFICHKAEKYLGHDAPAIVIDEAVGYLLAVMFLPVSIYTSVLAFVLFRFFDIVKPFPISRVQKLPGGFGIVADDALAGIAANLIIRLIFVIGL